jgi:cob(I)alamin adenosyltransferase
MSMDADAEAARWREKMARRKAVQDAEVSGKTIEKALLLVHTGPGKGKTTAAMGLALRMLGRGRSVAIVQFIKGAWSTGERMGFERFAELLSWHSMGEGFTWETQDRARDIAACARAWDEAQAQMARPEVSLVVLDELCIALRYEYLDIAAVMAVLTARRPDLHVVVTGRNAPAALVEAADLVTEMQAVKHPFKAGVKAQEGIEF